MSITVKIDMPSANQLVRNLGLDEKGDAQRFHTMNINRRIGKYMPHLNGTLETKLKFVRSNTEIEVLGPYAQYQYRGKAMVDSQTGKGPAYIPGVGYRFRKGAVLTPTDRNLKYSTDSNPLAGPYWDRALVAAEGSAISEDLKNFVARRTK